MKITGAILLSEYKFGAYLGSHDTCSMRKEWGQLGSTNTNIEKVYAVQQLSESLRKGTTCFDNYDVQALHYSIDPTVRMQ